MTDPVKSNAAAESDRTIEALLRGNALPRLELSILLAHALGMTRTALLSHVDRGVTADSANRFRQLVERRSIGEPIAYLVGSREFYSLDFTVTSDVLIPRPETELLLDAVLATVDSSDAGCPILDLGTGSGAIAVAIGHSRPGAKIVATDISGAALRIAEANARRHGVALELIQSDWYESLGSRRFEVIASNPPYVAAGDAHLESGDVRFEPKGALVGGLDGFASIRKVIAGARRHLNEGGRLLFEHGYDQGEGARCLLEDAGFVEVATLRDMSGHERVCTGRNPAGGPR
jgi:release factor glutamine methyltransferase